MSVRGRKQTSLVLSTYFCININDDVVSSICHVWQSLESVGAVVMVSSCPGASRASVLAGWCLAGHLNALGINSSLSTTEYISFYVLYSTESSNDMKQCSSIAIIPIGI
jgi:hypothetical protein